MFIQDFYLGLDGKQRIIVLSATGAFGGLLLCCVLWLFSGGQTATNLSDQELLAITSGQTEVNRKTKTTAAAILSAPTAQQVEIVHAGLMQGTKPSAASMQSKARSQEALQAYKQAHKQERSEVRLQVKALEASRSLPYPRPEIPCQVRRLRAL